MTTRRSTRLRIGGTDTPWARTPGNPSARPRRAPSGASSITSIERASNESPAEAARSIHLKVKAPPSKLREVTSGVSINSRDSLEGTEVVSGPRKSRSKKAIVEESSEDEDEDEDVEGDIDDEELDEDAEGDDDEDDEDADGDVDMEDVYEKSLPVPPAPKPSIARPKVTIRRANPSNGTKSIEDKEMEEEEEDEELSEMESQDEEQVDELGEDEEGVEDEEGDEEDAEGDDDIDSDDETPSGSRGGTPDLSKLTRRQRAAYEEMDGGLMALSNEAQKKKHLTAEEHAMRRAEMARRRKNLSEKRNEEEKMDTINRLLKKQAPKRRGRVKDVNTSSVIAAAAEDGATPGEDSGESERPSPFYTRWVNHVGGTTLSIPEEWLDAPVGRIFEGAKKVQKVSPMAFGKMVEEVQ
ncbi:MAG: hypothetical protein Q9157_000015 [Trypethelium eluteriae]